MTPLYFTHVRLISNGTRGDGKSDGIRGHVVAFDGKKETHIGYSLENDEKLIPPGVFKVGLHRWSVNGKLRAHLLDVPKRSYILVHELNKASQSLGCIGTASGAVRDTFDWIAGSTAQKVADMVSAASKEGREVYWETVESKAVRDRAKP
jgi:hypothetical protein